MRVAIVTPGGVVGRGGMASMAASLVRRLAEDAELRYEVVDPYGPRINTAGAKLLMPIHFIGAVFYLFASCAAHRIDLAHVHMATAGSVCRKLVLLRLCRLFGVPTIIHLHGGNLPEFCAAHPYLSRLLRREMVQAAEIVVLGRFWRDFVRDRLAVPESRITILPNAIAGPETLPDRAAHEICEILFLGMVTAEKGLDELLIALASPMLAPLRWRMIIAGSGQVAHYRRIADELGLGARVDFVGWVDEAEVRRRLESADLLVLPSHFECLPMAIIEAMAHGVPVVATDVGAVGEAVEDGVTGLLVPVGDVGALAEAMGKLLANPGLRQSFGREGRTRFRQSFDIAIFHERLTRIYRKHLLPANDGGTP
jgi:glycosyltransferase involved in cell wall biosynthesis